MNNTDDTGAQGPPVDTSLPADVSQTMPPGVPLSDDAVVIPAPLVTVADIERTVQHRRTATGSDRYLLLAQGLRDDPMNVVRRMTSGRYRYKRRRNLTLWVEHGAPVPELMSLRQAAAELERLTGEAVTHETLRRWWERIWPGEEPAPEGAKWVQQGRDQRDAMTQPDGPGEIPPATFLPPPA